MELSVAHPVGAGEDRQCAGVIGRGRASGERSSTVEQRTKAAGRRSSAAAARCAVKAPNSCPEHRDVVTKHDAGSRPLVSAPEAAPAPGFGKAATPPAAPSPPAKLR